MATVDMEVIFTNYSRYNRYKVVEYFCWNIFGLGYLLAPPPTIPGILSVLTSPCVDLTPVSEGLRKRQGLGPGQINTSGGCSTRGGCTTIASHHGEARDGQHHEWATARSHRTPSAAWGSTPESIARQVSQRRPRGQKSYRRHRSSRWQRG